MMSLTKPKALSLHLLVVYSGAVNRSNSNWRTWTKVLNTTGWRINEQPLDSVSFDKMPDDPPDILLLVEHDSNQDSWAIALCKELQSNPRLAHWSVVIAGNPISPNAAVQAFRAGAVDYLSTQLSSKEAIARLQRHATTSRRFSALLKENQTLSAQITKAQEIEDTLRGQAAQEKIFTELTQRIRQSLKLSTILNATVREVRQLLKTDRVLVYRFNPDWSGEIAIESVSTERLSILGALIHDPCFEHHWNRRYLEGQVCAIDDVRALNLNPCYLNLLESLNVRANLVLPILQQNRLWGLLIAHHCQDARAWQPWEIELLKKLSAQLAIAIQQSELYYRLQSANQELERLANLDSLTQLANRRQFDRYITQEWLRLKREKQPIALLLCDIDHFKQYNDTYGHQAGDDCLRQVAEAITSVIKRPADLAARYGGEEFAIILPNTNLEGAIEVAEQLQAAINRLHIHNKDVYLTLSIGIACMLPSLHSASDRLITMADQVLYQAKTEGRDRYCVWQQNS